MKLGPKRLSCQAAIVFAAFFFYGEAQAQSPSVQRGVALARTNCARCHSIDRLSPSPLVIAPPFRDLHRRYPVESLAEALAEGIVTSHPTMPEYRFDPDQIGDFIAYLKSLQP